MRQTGPLRSGGCQTPAPPHISVLLHLLRVHAWLAAVVLGAQVYRGQRACPPSPVTPGCCPTSRGVGSPPESPSQPGDGEEQGDPPGPGWWLLRGRHPSTASLCNPPPPDCSAASTHPRASPQDPGRGSPSSLQAPAETPKLLSRPSGGLGGGAGVVQVGLD